MDENELAFEKIMNKRKPPAVPFKIYKNGVLDYYPLRTYVSKQNLIYFYRPTYNISWIALLQMEFFIKDILKLSIHLNDNKITKITILNAIKLYVELLNNPDKLKEYYK